MVVSLQKLSFFWKIWMVFHALLISFPSTAHIDCIYSNITFLCPRHKMARGHLVFALSVLPSFRHSVLPSFRPSVASKFVFSTPPTSLHGFEWNLVQMLYHKSRSACGEIIHVRQILQSYGPWHLEFVHILACLLNSSYILAWIWMKLGRDVAPQV